jgi:hypothetical protein
MKTRIANRRRCGARVKNQGPSYRGHDAEMQRARRRSERCQNWALPGSRRCRLHGAFSTGARTPEGKQRQAEGRRRWLERLGAEGKKPGPPKGTGGRPRASDDPLRDFRTLPEIKAKRRLTEAATRLARARSVLRHANSASAEYRRKRREAQQEAKREVQRLLEEHQGQRRDIGLPPLSGKALDDVLQAFRQRVAVSVPFDPTPRWPNVRELEDKVRDAEDALERAKAEAIRAERQARVRDATALVDHAQGPAPFPLKLAERIKAAKEALLHLRARM